MKLIILFLSFLIFTLSYADEVLVIHGLNARPEKMQDIVDVLELQGHKTYRIRLTGHHVDNFTDFLNVSKEKWERDFILGYNKLKGKKHVVAYSLGGLITVYSLMKNSNIRFESITLLAPAVSTPWYSKSIKFLGSLGLKKLPSFAPQGEQIHKSTPVIAYETIFKLEKLVNSVGEARERLNQMNVTILMDSDDKLVSYKGVKNWLKKNQLNWGFKDLNCTRAFGHMLVIKEFQTKESWTQLSQVLTF